MCGRKGGRGSGKGGGGEGMGRGGEGRGEGGKGEGTGVQHGHCTEHTHSIALMVTVHLIIGPVSYTDSSPHPSLSHPNCTVDETLNARNCKSIHTALTPCQTIPQGTPRSTTCTRGMYRPIVMTRTMGGSYVYKLSSATLTFAIPQ